MEEQSKPEQELSEEQLGKISGGCRACEAGKSDHQYHLDRIIDGYPGLINAQKRGDHAAVAQITASIAMHQDQIAQLAKDKQAREATPGHVAIQAGDPGYVHPTLTRR
jgi:hypothetical protein